MAARDTQPGGTTAQKAEIQQLVRLQEAAQIRTQAREAAHVAAWAEARTKIRGAVALTVLAALVVGIAIGYYGLRPLADATPQTITPPERWSRPVGEAGINDPGAVRSATITPWPIRVYVSGAVAEAQIVELPPGSLVADALRAAGGPTENADSDALNLAAPLSDNQHVVMPTRRAVSSDVGSEERLPIARININTATVDELQRLPAIGVGRAQDIVAFREAHGPFLQIDDILAVPGIGPSILEQIKPFITVGP